MEMGSARAHSDFLDVKSGSQTNLQHINHICNTKMYDVRGLAQPNAHARPSSLFLVVHVQSVCLLIRARMERWVLSRGQTLNTGAALNLVIFGVGTLSRCLLIESNCRVFQSMSPSLTQCLFSDYLSVLAQILMNFA